MVNSVLTSQPELREASEDPETEESLEEVVSEHQLLNIKGWFPLHEGWPNEPHEHIICCTQTHCWPGRRHQHPVIHPGVSQLSHDELVLLTHVQAGVVGVEQRTEGRGQA